MDYGQAADEFMRLMVDIRGNDTETFHKHIKGEAFVLHILSHSEGVVLPSQLCSMTQTSSARIAATLGSLEQKGCITREIDPKDRRKILVRITPEGQKKQQAMQQCLHEKLEVILRELGENDAKELLRIMARLAEINRGTQMNGGSSRI